MHVLGMTHAPNSNHPTAPVPTGDPTASAVRLLARLIARQAAGEFLREGAQEGKGSDHDPQDEQAG